MRSGNETPKEDKSSYEITSDGRVKVNVAKLLENPKVREFYRSIRQMAVEKTPKSEA